MADSGEVVRVRGESDAPEVMAVRVDDVKAEFGSRYITAQSDATKRADVLRKQFGRAIGRATESGAFAASMWGGDEWMWRIE
jgi:hypothetical protein